MAKRKVKWELYSYGIYSRWERSQKELPKLVEITDIIPITPDVEFGYVIKIQGAKGKVIDYRIDHPYFIDPQGDPSTFFEGQYFINSNDYVFFLGDTVWEPYADKAGDWMLKAWLDGELLAEKKLTLVI